MIAGGPQNPDATLGAALTEAAEAEGRDAFSVEVDGFEGPLHVLLDLAKRQKVDLLRVSILQLAEQYLAFVQEARTQRIDLAADYLLMAAWLAWLKSRLLLPKPATARPDADADAAPDLARALALRLRRLEAFRQVGEALQARDVMGRDVFQRGAPERAVVIRKPLWQDTLMDLMRAFADHQNRAAAARPHEVRRQPVFALEAARDRLREGLRGVQTWRPLDTFVPSSVDLGEAVPRRSAHASVFSAALELTRDRAIDLRQDGLFDQLYVRRATDPEGHPA
jgi:segregation and condensation protein A